MTRGVRGGKGQRRYFHDDGKCLYKPPTAEQRLLAAKVVKDMAEAFMKDDNAFAAANLTLLKLLEERFVGITNEEFNRRRLEKKWASRNKSREGK